jgi:hypothetical protein
MLYVGKSPRFYIFLIAKNHGFVSIVMFYVGKSPRFYIFLDS